MIFNNQLKIFTNNEKCNINMIADKILFRNTSFVMTQERQLLPFHIELLSYGRSQN